MKKLLILSLLLLLSSCSTVPIEVINPQKVTTQEIIELSEKDSIVYKAVYLDNTLYLYNTKTKLVEKELYNFSGALKIFVLWFVILFLCFIVYVIFNE